MDPVKTPSTDTLTPLLSTDVMTALTFVPGTSARSGGAGARAMVFAMPSTRAVRVTLFPSTDATPQRTGPPTSALRGSVTLLRAPPAAQPARNMPACPASPLTTSANGRNPTAAPSTSRVTRRPWSSTLFTHPHASPPTLKSALPTPALTAAGRRDTATRRALVAAPVPMIAAAAATAADAATSAPAAAPPSPPRPSIRTTTAATN